MFSICYILVIYFQLIFTFSTYFNNRLAQKRFSRRENMENITLYIFFSLQVLFQNIAVRAVQDTQLYEGDLNKSELNVY